MAKSKNSWDEAKIARLYKEGRGKGRKAEYSPWLTTYDVASIGRSHRVHGVKTGRIHHLLSDGEWRTFLHLDWCSDVEDIREQFPLEREKTRRIADELGVRHPVDTTSQTPLVMTTDFLVDIRRDGQLKLEACAVKPAVELEKERTLEKLEIERRFWAEQNVPWTILTERDFDAVVTRNLQWLRGLNFSLQNEQWIGFHREQSLAVIAAVPRCAALSLREFCVSMDQNLALEAGSTLATVRYLLTTRGLTTDLTVPLNDRRPMSDFHPGDPRYRQEAAS